jgi:hypothetical protein
MKLSDLKYEELRDGMCLKHIESGDEYRIEQAHIRNDRQELVIQHCDFGTTEIYTLNACHVFEVKNSEVVVNFDNVKIAWGKILRPGESNPPVPYDHVWGETPFGKILVTWKSWILQPVYTLTVDESPFDFDISQWQHCKSVKECLDVIEVLYRKKLAEACGVKYYA